MSKEFDAWYFGMFPLEREMINAGSASSARNREQYLRCWQASRESLPSLFTAVDMTTAAAQGFKDGAASKSEPCDGCFMAEAEALRKNSDRYLHLKATWDDGLLLERLGGNVLPADWDAEIDKDMSKESP